MGEPEKVLWTSPDGKTRVVQLSWGVQAQRIVTETTLWADAPVGEFEGSCGDDEIDIYEACVLALAKECGRV